TTTITRGSDSHNTVTANNGSITATAGGSEKVVTKVRDNGFAGGVKRTDTTTYEASRGRTFSSDGSDPGDQQSLEIKSNTTVSEELKEEYETPRFLAVGGTEVVWPYESETLTTTRSTGTTYTGSHSLGADGVSSVGGELTASNKSEISVELDYGGTTFDNGAGQTYELIANTATSGYTHTQTETGSYGSGQTYGGRANSTSDHWHRSNAETRYTDQIPDYQEERTYQETSDNSNYHTISHEFQANGSSATVKRGSNSTVTESGTQSIDSFGEMTEHNFRNVTESDFGPDGSSENTSNRGWGVIGGSPPPGIGPTYHGLSSDSQTGPATTSQTGNSGPVSPGFFTVFATVAGLGQSLGAIGLGAAEGLGKSFGTGHENPNSAGTLAESMRAAQRSQPGSNLNQVAKDISRDTAGLVETGLLSLPGGTFYEVGQLLHGEDATGKKATGWTLFGAIAGVLSGKWLGGAGDEVVENADNATKAAAKGVFAKPKIADLVNQLEFTLDSKNAKAVSEHFRAVLGAKPGERAHHILPLEAARALPDLFRRGAKGGFDINGAGNGRPLPWFDHPNGHPKYNQDVIGALTEFGRFARRKSFSDAQIAQGLQGIADSIGNAIDNGWVPRE
ncbi:MAG: AHH domain-containing protein, partial [Planctomycetota bacterium]